MKLKQGGKKAFRVNRFKSRKQFNRHSKSNRVNSRLNPPRGGYQM